MSQHLYDLLQTLGVNPQTEIDTLQYLFSEEGSVPIYSYGRPLEEYIDKEVFRNLKMRGTFVHVADMRNALGISSNQLRGTFEKLFLFSEFLIAVLTEGEEQISRNSAANKQAQVIIRNILAILDKSNHKLYDTGDQHYIIIEDNKAASQAIEYVSDNEISKEIIEYNHYKLKGDLQQKQGILALLATYIEPILKDRRLSSKYPELFSDTSFLLNCFHIRHNNKTGSKAQEYISSIDNTTLETWYDRAYNMVLSVILAEQNTAFSAILTELKSGYTWKT